MIRFEKGISARRVSGKSNYAFFRASYSAKATQMRHGDAEKQS
jgi:hypothetical protein